MMSQISNYEMYVAPQLNLHHTVCVLLPSDGSRDKCCTVLGTWGNNYL